VTSTNSLQVVSMTNSRAEVTIDAHYEANYK